MKKTGITTACICLTLATSLSAYAQNKEAIRKSAPLYECIYSYTINCEVQEAYSIVLQIGKDFSRFYDYTAYAVDSLSAVPGVSEDEKKQLEERR